MLLFVEDGFFCAQAGDLGVFRSRHGHARAVQYAIEAVAQNIGGRETGSQIESAVVDADALEQPKGVVH